MSEEPSSQSKWIVRAIFIVVVMFLMNPDAREHSKEARYYVDAMLPASLKFRLAMAQLNGTSTREQQANVLYCPIQYKNYYLFSKAQYYLGESYGIFGIVFFKYNSISGIGAFRKLFFSDAGVCVDLKK